MESKLVPTAPIALAQETRRRVFRPLVLLAWLLAGISLVLAAFAPILHILNNVGPMHNVDFKLAEVVMSTLFPLVGALIASRQPRNPVGWILCMIGLSEALSIFCGQYSVDALLTHPHALPFGAEVSWLEGWDWSIGFSLTTLLLLLFPNGHFLSRWWRWVAWFSIGAAFLDFLSVAIPTWNLRGTPLLNIFSTGQNPLTGINDLTSSVSFAVMTLAALAAAICLIIRLRYAKDIERQQLKWFAYSAALVAIDLLANNIYESYFVQTALLTSIEKIVEALVTATLPLAMGIAMFRYRLYDIDVLIKRTLVYGLLTGILVFIYFGSVVVLQYALRAVTGQESQFAIVTSTLVIAILFQPLRRRIQKIIDRRFYRRQYNTEQTLQSFSASLRNEVDLEQLRVHLISVIEETIQPTHVSLWLSKSTAKPEQMKEVQV